MALPKIEHQQSKMDLAFADYLKRDELTLLSLKEVSSAGFEKSNDYLSKIGQAVSAQSTASFSSFQMLARNVGDYFTNLGGLLPKRAERLRAIAAQEESAAVSDAQRKTPNILVGIGEILQNIEDDMITLTELFKKEIKYLEQILDIEDDRLIEDEENEREDARGKNERKDVSDIEADKLKGEGNKFGLAKLVGIISGIVISGGALALSMVDFEDMFKKMKTTFGDLWNNGLIPLYENVLVPIGEWFTSIALPALGDTFTRFIDDITDFFSGIGEVGKLIGEGDYLGAAKKAVEAIGEFLFNTIDNLLTLGADLIGIDLGGETVFGAIGNWFTDLGSTVSNWFKDNIYDGENNKIFGMQLTSGSMEWSEWYTNLKTKISTWFKDNIYDGENNKIFGFAIPEKLFEFNMFQTIKQPIDDVIDTIEQIFSGDFSMETLLKGGKAFLALVSTPLNLAINAIKGIFKWGDPEEPFRLSKFITDAVASIKSFFTNEEGTGLFDWGDPKEPFRLSEFIQETINKAIDWVKGIFGFGKSDDGGILPKIEMPNPLTSLSEGLRKSDLTLVGIDFGAKIADVIDSITGTDDIEPMEKGGPIQEDKPYLVGEAGPELIIPNSSGKVIPAPQTGAILDAGSRMMADNARVSVSPVIAPQSNDNRTIVSNKSVTYQGHMTTRNSDPTIRALNSSLAYA